ncbi:MAG: DsbA family protein [Roseovarius sp.]
MRRLIATGALALAMLTGPALAQGTDAPDTSQVTEMTMGPEDAPVTVVEYASFTCPHCGTFHAGPLKQLKADYIEDGQVHFIYRDVYFDRYGLWASMVARCGGEDRFFGIADMLYEQQSDWTQGEPTEIADNLRRIGRVAGLDSDTLDACMNDEDKAKALVAWYQQNAEADEVESTPTLIINDEKHSNMSYDELKAIIDAELEG